MVYGIIMAFLCTKVDPGGSNQPPPRTNHASCWTDNKFVVYGGNGPSKNQNCMGDVWILDTGAMTWAEVQGSGVTARLPLPPHHGRDRE